ncbi:MAG: hypothetical protein QOF58_285 [Pseudonocardiales bacterium]|jgi:hypothetical protein|nr:hypothetical protein [Pseudonocardiales bacterium]
MSNPFEFVLSASPEPHADPAKYQALAADRVHQALALLNGTEDQVLPLLLVAACRIITVRLMTPDEAAQPEVVGYDNGPVYTPVGTQLLCDASVLLAEAGQHLVREGGKS